MTPVVTSRRSSLINLLVLVMASAIALTLLEIAAPVVFRANMGRSFSRKEATAGLEAAQVTFEDVVALDEPGFTQDHVLHPYLGFVDLHTATLSPGNPHYVNTFGFVGMDPIQTRDPATLIVGIFGGSVANILYRGSRGHIVERLRALYPEREIKIVCGALAGYKQPQQLLALAYFHAIGGEFDIVVNVDGYNEIALPHEENILAGVNPFFPRSWKAYARKALDKRIMGKIGEITRVRDRRAAMKKVAQGSLLRHSSFALVLWSALDTHAATRIKELNTEILAIIRDDREADYQTTGPEFAFTGLGTMYARLVATWSQCSRQMDGMARANGFSYYHFLQPNQYHRGSKTLTSGELAHAYLPNTLGAKAAERAYPLLRAAGRELGAQGVCFTDLSMLFQDVSTDIYVDDCCHYNALGNRMVMKAIVDVITADLKARGLAEKPRS
ncbi:hypothetical protein JXA88_11320 [Candidatus Fermentibacteria bacterium]|nr:hypothetical protein [Candidatus Fermentibacteria bacterium]